MARLRTAIALALALVLCAGIAPAADAAKKKAKSKVFAATVAPNAAVPEAAVGARSAPLTSTITVGKKFKGKVVGDVNVTALQTTGSGSGAANDLAAYLIAPNGRTLQLFFSVGDQSLGFWTLDDDSPVAICPFPPATPCADPAQSLKAPFAGVSNLTLNWVGTFPVNGSLAIFNGLKMRGTWTLLVTDLGPPGATNGTSVLNTWGLRIRPAKPVPK